MYRRYPFQIDLTADDDVFDKSGSEEWFIVRALEGNDTILTGSGRDWVEGGEGDDTIRTGAGDDWLEGGEGGDTLDGGDGFDRASYDSSKGGVHVDLAQGQGWGFEADGDTLVNIEGLIGSAYDDVLAGDKNDNLLAGGEGDDELLGREGDDILNGGEGSDYLEGGDGTDTASYVYAASGVVVDLAAGVGYAGEAVGDRFDSIENLTGSFHDDKLIGDDRDNVIEGLHGNDVLDGGDGNDILDGGLGDDTLNGGEGDDILHGVFGTNELNGGDGNDRLIGGSESDLLDGGDGDDVLRPGTGLDYMIGGSGDDTFLFSINDGLPQGQFGGLNVIADFTAGGTEDVIDLTQSGSGYASLADVLANASYDAGTPYSPAGTWIDLGAIGQVFLNGVNVNQLTSDDFLF